MSKNNNVHNNEKTFNVKANKEALEKFMAKFFWYAIIIITILAFFLLVMSVGELQDVWGIVEDSLHEAWMLVRVPFTTTILCLSWFGMVTLFVYLVRKS